MSAVVSGGPRRGDIVDVKVPEAHTVGREQFGHPKRPYLLISVKRGRYPLWIGCPITSAREAPAFDFEVAISNSDLAEGCIDDGRVLVQHIRSFDPSRVVEGRPRTRVTNQFLGEVEADVLRLLGARP